jgi:lipopolysaccharide transport system ATP-binding protein
MPSIRWHTRSMPVAVLIEDVTKRYRLRRERRRTLKELVLRQYTPPEEIFALRDVSLTVGAGESVGVIGANGSGKSTLLKLVAGTTRPTTGRVEVEGRVSALLELGVGFHPDFTGRENAYLTGSILGLSRKELERLMPAIAEFADIGPFFDAAVKTYSSGMYMRLAFTVAVHVDPDVLLVDEVLAVGDEFFQRRCFERIADFRARGKTIMFVSHDLGAVARICDRAILLDHGRIQAEGDVRQVIDSYANSVRYREDGGMSSEKGAKRWGSGEVTLESIRIVNGDGQETRLLRSGTPATVELGYLAREPVENVEFGVCIFREDGLTVYGSNTSVDGVPLRLDPGRGTVRYLIPRLDLLEGRYVLDVTARSDDGSATYDYHAKTHRFTVYGGPGDVGMVRLPHEWQIETDRD